MSKLIVTELKALQAVLDATTDNVEVLRAKRMLSELIDKYNDVDEIWEEQKHRIIGYPDNGC